MGSSFKFLKKMTYLILLASFVLPTKAYAKPSCSDVLRLSVPVPRWYRSNDNFQGLRNILYRWHANTHEAKYEARNQGSIELQEVGIDYEWVLPPGGLEIRPEMLPKPKLVSLNQYALLHPRMKPMLEQMNAEGYKLIIDPIMAVDSDTELLKGVFISSLKEIRLLPKARWDIFMHEYQHLIFAKMGFKSIIQFYGPIENVPEPAKELAEKVFKLRDRGLSNLAVDETLAVQAEIKALYKMGYTPWSLPVYEARKYAWYHQLNGLVGDEMQNKKNKRDVAIKKVLLHPTLLRALFIVGSTFVFFINPQENQVIAVDEQGAQSVQIVLNQQSL